MRGSDPVLLVEDNKIDIQNVRRILQKLGIPNPLHVTRHGEQALAFLRQEKPYHTAPRPRLVILDLNMPVMNGIELVRRIKADPALASIPLVVLTSSCEQGDIETCFALGVSGYFTKPIELDELEAEIAAIFGYWRRSKQPD